MLSKISAQLARGFAMGVADIIPGVSGGTIALVLGIYERLLDAIRTGAKGLGALARGDVEQFLARFKSVDWLFLLPLVTGIGVAFVSLAGVIEELLHDRPEEMAGLFFGLVIGSIWVAWKLVGDRSRLNLAAMVVVGAVMFFLLGFSSGPVADPPLIAYFGAGAIAICAMILPGISGSFLLLMMGMYATLLAAVHDRDLVPVLVFLVGATIGLALFSLLLGTLLDRYHDIVLAVLIGLMIGSLRVLWPWPNGVGIISDVQEEAIDGTGLDWPTVGDFWLPAVLAFGAAAVVIAISEYATARLDRDAVASQ